MTTLQVSISDTADDGYQYTSYLDTGYVFCGWAFGLGHLIGFLRFALLALPQGATINSATVTLNITSILGTPDTTIYGVDEDDAAAFYETGNMPSAAATTTASADADPSGTGTHVITVTSIVQEIVNRAGWESSNAIAFVIKDNIGAGNDYWGAEDYQDAGTAEAVFDVDYTDGLAIPVVMAQYRQRWN